MKKKLLIAFAFILFGCTSLLIGQTKETKKVDPNVFDEKAAVEQAKAKGLKASEIKGYVQFLKNDFSSKKALTKQKHKHSPYEMAGSQGVQETVIYLNPNQPMSLGCPNMGFEQYNFNGWTGGIGTVATGAIGGNPNYTSTGAAIVNTAGNNVSQANTTNYHTILSLPPIDPNFLNINGYDSLACKAVGTQSISQIPFVSPFSFDPVSVRMNGANSNYRACRLKYITTTSSTNQRLSFSYAVILQNPSGHAVEESPYFKVEVKNEGTGAILPGCTSYTFNPKSSLPSDSLMQSVTGNSFDPTFYRKWQYYSVDLSTLPAGTNVSVNFEVGGCTLGGHWGYAYVDAECGGIGTPYANMCSGTTFATLVAPTGFNTYQWYGPGGLIVGATNDTLIENPATAGTTYSVSMISPGGCAITQTVTIGLTTVSIININATSSCAGGNSGTAYVQASGSNGVYTYSWTNTTPGSVGPAGTSQTATGLAPGTYSVLVSSTTCGQASANLSVGVSPPFFISQGKSFCGNSTSIIQPGGSGYIWYFNGAPIAAPNGNNDTLSIPFAVAGDQYTVVYNNAAGCRDSIIYTLNQITGGNSYFSNTTNVCPSGTNGTTVLNLSTPFSAPYNYIITGPTAATTVSNTSTAATSLTLTSLAPGTYSAVITDGTCIYNNTVTIGVIQTNFTLTPMDTTLCYPQPVTVNFDFGDVVPANCGLSGSGGCSTPNTVQVGFGTLENSTTSYPAIYSNWYKNARHQILYKASELIAAGVQPGKISSIGFNVSSNTGTTTYPNFTIKMKCTTVQDLTSTTFDNVGLIQVFTTATANVAIGWNTYNFPTAYEWDGTSNILIDVCSDLTANYTYNASSPYTVTSFNSVRWFNSDVTPACMTTNLANNFAPGSTQRPNIRFENCGASSPSSYTIAVSSNGTVTTNFANDSIVIAPNLTLPPVGNGSVIYTVSVTNPVGLCVATQTVEIFYPPVSTTVNVTPTTFSLCEGASTTFSASGAFNYSWASVVGGVSTPFSTSPSVTVTPPNVGVNTYVVSGTSPCGTIPDTKTVTVNVTEIADLIISPLTDAVKCLNSSHVFNSSVSSSIPSNPGTPYSYSWTTIPGNNPATGVNNTSSYTANNIVTQTYVLTVNGVCANADSDTVTVSNFVNNLAVSIIDSSTTCANTPFNLNSSVTGGYPNYTYSWFILPNVNSISSNSFLSATSPDTQGSYTVAVVVSDSCAYQQTAYEIIVVLPPCSVTIPNIITPNGDGANEFFKIKNLEFHPNTSVTIFDRWGKKVFESPNYNNEWKADGVSDGTFFYVIEVPDDKKYSGFITVFKEK